MLSKLKNFSYLTIGTLLLAIGVYFFKTPNGFATGGVSGLAIVLNRLIFNVTGHEIMLISTGSLITIMNVILLIVGFIFINRDFGIKTVYCTLLYSGVIWILEFVFERWYEIDLPLTEQPLLELFFATILAAVGSALLFNVDASSGGTDIIAMILKEHTAINVGTALLIADSVVAVSAFFVFDVTTGLFSIFGLFIKSFLIDGIIENLNLCKFFTILTEKPDEICDYIMTNLHHGVTKHEAEGAFSHRKKTVILTVCKRYEAHVIKTKIKELDPSAFIMITNSSEILGRGFRSL